MEEENGAYVSTADVESCRRVLGRVCRAIIINGERAEGGFAARASIEQGFVSSRRDLEGIRNRGSVRSAARARSSPAAVYTDRQAGLPYFPARTMSLWYTYIYSIYSTAATTQLCAYNLSASPCQTL